MKEYQKMKSDQLHITQHKRFVLRTHPNFCFAKTSFMPKTLYAIGFGTHLETKIFKWEKIYERR